MGKSELIYYVHKSGQSQKQSPCEMGFTARSHKGYAGRAGQ